ncbi:diadenosine tetraphosphate (Ap4A) HIT family hydrolase [Bradyrhizobium sp. USDA 4011]
MPAAYDNNNPFAKILRGEFPSYKVYENEHVLAFLDIMPRSRPGIRLSFQRPLPATSSTSRRTTTPMSHAPPTRSRPRR